MMYSTERPDDAGTTTPAERLCYTCYHLAVAVEIERLIAADSAEPAAFRLALASIKAGGSGSLSATIDCLSFLADLGQVSGVHPDFDARRVAEKVCKYGPDAVKAQQQLGILACSVSDEIEEELARITAVDQALNQKPEGQDHEFI